jgi:hypothetical protein
MEIDVENPVAEKKSASDVVDALSFQQPFLLGTIRAHETVARLKTSWGDLEAWKRETLPRRILIWAVQRFRHPEDYHNYRLAGEQEKAGDPSMRDTADGRKDAVEAKRRREAAESVAVPPPPEFFEALKKLKGALGE